MIKTVKDQNDPFVIFHMKYGYDTFILHQLIFINILFSPKQISLALQNIHFPNL